MKKILLLLSFVAFSFFANAQNYALDFNGGSSYVDAGNMVGNNVRTIECWFMLSSNYNSSSPDHMSLICRNDATQFSEYSLYFSYTTPTAGNLVFARRVSGVLYYVKSNSATWNAGVWYHVAGVIDPVSGMKMYVNGALQSSTDPSTQSTSNASEITGLGVWGDAAIRFLDGQMDEVRFWNRALSQSEIMANMCTEINPATSTGLVGYYKVNEGSGIIANDASTNNYDATSYSCTYSVVTNCIVGIEESVFNVSINTFPNPNNGLFTIQADENILFIEICNLLGQTIYSTECNSTETNINMLNQAKGIYFVKIKTESGVGIKKIVKE